MDKGQGQTNGHTTEAAGCQPIGGTQNDQQEEKGQDYFDQEGCPEAITTGGMGTPAISG